VLDAGRKAMPGDAAMPAPPAIAGMRLSAEHARIELQRPSETPRIGERLELVVGYSDTAIWPVAARGTIK
jgi:D-serine deaminase-like pyridoxal phosphate-dependent protein